MKKRFSILALLLAFAMIVAACSSNSDDTTTTTTTTEPVMEETSVLDLAIEAGQFSTLIAAIDAAGLAETLEGEGPFTVLAPTDAAFDAAFEALGITAADLLADTETLTAILTYHVLPQEADSQLVATLDGSSVATVNGQSVDVNVVDGQIMINEATVVSADLVADNGIVHVIDGVLLPPDVAEALGVAMADDMEEETTTTTEATTTTTEAMDPTIAEIVADAASGDPAEFTVLLAALETAGLVDALSGEGPFTVFAPTDAAFAALLEDLGVTAEELLANPDLGNILLYHVVSGEFLAADVIELAPVDVPTLYEENTISIAVVDGSVVINDVATVISPDVMASNGVIHVIDAVLVPAS
jgi:uncharacterized surface protein with fasciclin (FAS1) repeats